jgi:hypothetical protein
MYWVRLLAFFASPGQVVEALTAVVGREPQVIASTKVDAPVLTLTRRLRQWTDWPMGTGVGVRQGVAVGRGVGVLCSVVAVAVALGSVVAVASTALVVLVGSPFRELATWGGVDAPEVTAQ